MKRSPLRTVGRSRRVRVSGAGVALGLAAVAGGIVLLNRQARESSSRVGADELPQASDWERELAAAGLLKDGTRPGQQPAQLQQSREGITLEVFDTLGRSVEAAPV